MDIITKITRLKEEIADLNNKKARTEGTLETLTKELEENYGVKTVEEANTKIEEMTKEYQALDTEITTAVTELKEKYPEELGDL